VLENDAECVDRWSQAAEGATIFLNGPASGLQRLSLRGHIPIRPDEKRRLPAVAMKNCTIRAASTRLIQRPTVLVALEGAEGKGAEAALKTLGADREIRTIAWDGPQPPNAAFTVRPNRSASSGAKMPATEGAKSETFSKNAPPQKASPAQGETSLADVVYMRQPNGVWRGAASIEVQPNGNETFDLRLPAGSELVQALVGDMPAAPQKIGGDIWRISAASPNSRQRIDVVFGGVSPAASDDGRLRFESPALNGRAAKQTAWTILTPPNSTVGDPQNALSKSASQIAADRSFNLTAADAPTEVLRQTLAADYAVGRYVSKKPVDFIGLKIVVPHSRFHGYWIIAAVFLLVLVVAAALWHGIVRNAHRRAVTVGP